MPWTRESLDRANIVKQAKREGRDPDDALREAGHPPRRGPGRPRKDPPGDPALLDVQESSADRDTPPKGAATGKAPPRRPPVGAPSKARGKAIAKRITELVHFTAGIVAMRDQFDAAVLAAGAPKLGETYGAVLERHPRMLMALEQFEQGGVYGAAAIATLTVALPIAAHHNLIPAGPLTALANALIPQEVAARMQGYGQAAQAAAANGNPGTAAI